MEKQEAVKWIVESGNAVNEFAAGGIWEGLTLWKFDTEEQKKKVISYREWREISRNTKLCFAYVLANIEIPKMYKET